MAVKIRLTRVGKKKSPTYRIVAANQTSKRDGRFLELLGRYEPKKQPAGLTMDMDRVNHWLKNGATPTVTVSQLIKQASKGAS